MRLVTRGSVFLLFLASFLLTTQGYAQSFLTCATGATNLIDRAEGLAEPSGDILINCANGTPGATVITNILISYNVPVTNRLVNGVPDAMLTLDTGVGPVPVNVIPSQPSTNMLAFNGVSLVVPKSGAAAFRISNVRLNVNYVGAGRSVVATLSTSSLSLTNPVVTVATPSSGLLATYASTGITCTGSPLPATLNFVNLLQQTNFASTRVTEGFGNAFTVKDAGSDTGTRILLRYTNFPSTARIFIPDYVAGSDAQFPTAAGDIGGIPSAGAYSPSVNGTLLLARVMNADATGAGGFVVGAPANFTAGTVSEVQLTGGSGTAVYEVIDANNQAQESAQFPTFIGLPANTAPAVANEAVSFGPFNTISTSAAALPVPRFAAPDPASDCPVTGDCGATYFPKLSVSTSGLQFSVSPTGNILTQFIQVNNTAGGTLEFAVTVTYQGTAQGWLTVTDQSGNSNHTTLRVDAQPIGLSQGTYQASVIINAGAAGFQTLPVTFVIGPGQITIGSIVNAASFQTGPLVAGSLATIKGSNLAGKNVAVTFNGIAGSLLYTSATQINVQVPASLASNSSVQVVVTVDGNSSAPSTVALAAISPGIFGVLNQDSSLNTSANPAANGSVIQIFATGLISPISSGVVIVGLNNQGIPTLYSGGFPNGLQQVNAQLPANASSIPGVLTVCGVNASGTVVCSPTVTIYTKP